MERVTSFPSLRMAPSCDIHAPIRNATSQFSVTIQVMPPPLPSCCSIQQFTAAQKVVEGLMDKEGEQPAAEGERSIENTKCITLVERVNMLSWSPSFIVC